MDRDFQREWLETNGIGGFACGTVGGAHTRRYHGLMTAATRPPVGRFLLLSKLEETLVVGESRYELSANQYPDVVHPQGYQYLKEFRAVPWPTFVYEADGVTVEKRVFMVHGENTVVVEYAILGDARLEVRPLIAFRDYHSLTHQNDAIDQRVDIGEGVASVHPYAGLPTLYFANNAESCEATEDWYLNFEYAIERERGLDFHEDLFQPFLMNFAAGTATIIASTELRDVRSAPGLRKQEKEHRRLLTENLAARKTPPPANGTGAFIETLTRAADQFIVKRGEHSTIIAGYPWFTDWGRDTMIALPGLTLATGRFNDAREILQAFTKVVDRGMLPNRFPDGEEQPEYNTVDATLWFFEAVRAYLAASGDTAFVDELRPLLRDIIEWHQRGTRYGIHVDTDGLLACGEPGVQLTWMDAKVGDWVVTPRMGKPVEIQALWYNALCFMEESAMASQANDSFNAMFWNEDTGCLYDVVDGDKRDASIRPNQIFAVSLHHSMLPQDRAARVVEVVKRELLTPLGLRTLSPKDPNYRGHYGGSQYERDSAYHQGTVWPWLMGPYLEACRRVGASIDKQWREPFIEHMKNNCAGQICEVADGDAPHRPGGCFAQAWSIAELLRAATLEKP